MKKLYFGSNLKMYKNIEDTVKYLRELTALTADISREEIELFIIPSYTTLDRATTSVDRSLVKLGAQNMCWEEQGQFTGEISPLMLREMGLDLVMIGHSERRHVFGETDEEENRKVKCGLEASNIGKIWVAYEPVWSIGVNGTPATADYAERMHVEIKKCLLELFGEAGEKIPVLYGGSVNPGNAEELIVQPSVDGLFVGRSAWQADKFNDLIRMAKKKAEADRD